MTLKVSDIIEAKKRMSNVVKTTELQYSERLSKLYNANIYLKREDTQKVRSYKIRGAYNLISSLSKKEQDAGVVCASAGNHAQGVAYTCNKLGIKGTIFMPLTTPEQKVYKTKKFGGEHVEVRLIGDTFDDAFAASKEFEKDSGATFVHPFDDEKIIEGQSTIGLEIIEQIKDKPNYILCPIGGGGVASGIISAMKELSPETKVIGVEPAGASSMKYAIRKGENIGLDSIDTFVDGAAVKKSGNLTYQICKDYDLEIIPVPENRVCTTILDYLKEDGIVMEPAGALATDALKDMRNIIKGKTVVVIVSGSNFDFERLPEVKERSMRYEGSKRYLVVNFPQRPGALKEFLGTLGEQDDITRFEYLKKSNKEKAPAFIGIETEHPDNFETIFSKLQESGINFEDVTNNELYFNLLV